MKKKKIKGIEDSDGEISLPEALMHHIQSFMSRDEAARTTILSKSWYNAWLTRPVLDFDDRDCLENYRRNYRRKQLENFAKLLNQHNAFLSTLLTFPDHDHVKMCRREQLEYFAKLSNLHDTFLTCLVLDFQDHEYVEIYRRKELENFGTRTMQRYRLSNLKIERFKLHTYYAYCSSTVNNLVVSAIKIGATDIQLEIGLPSKPSANLPLVFLPKQVLESETLLRLSLTGFTVLRNTVKCSSLKSLTLEHVDIIGVDVFNDIVSRCISIEELSLSKCSVLGPKPKIPFELHKLRRLYLDSVNVDMFLSKFESRFPCLKDLSIHQCHGYTSLQIASTSLQTVSFKLECGLQRAKFDVPSFRKFTYSGSNLPSFLSKKGGKREWDLDMSIYCNRLHNNSWFLSLKKLLNKFRLSRIISLSLHLKFGENLGPKHMVDTEVVPSPLEVENLVVYAPSTLRSALLFRLLGAFRPKFICHDHDLD